MKLSKRMAIMVVLVMILTMSFGSISVLADTWTLNGEDVDSGDYTKITVGFKKSDGTVVVPEQVFYKSSSDSTYYTLSGTTLTAATDDYNKLLKQVSNAKKNEAVDKIDTVTDTMNMEADMTGGAELISEELRDLIAKIIGGLTIVILTAIGLFTAIDIFYLEIPPLHTSLEEQAEAKGHVDKNGSVKPRLVSKDACDAYKEGAENQKNVILCYLKKRIVAYIAIAVVVFLLLTGQLTAIIKVVLKLISGVLTSATNI